MKAGMIGMEVLDINIRDAGSEYAEECQSLHTLIRRGHYIALFCKSWPVRDAEYEQYTGVRIKSRMLATSGKRNVNQNGKEYKKCRLPKRRRSGHQAKLAWVD